MNSIFEASWDHVVRGTGGQHLDAFFALGSRYSLADRRYHNLTHITHMAGRLLTIEAEGTGAYAWTDLHRAIWWHDCVYDSRAGDNEERSADVMTATLHEWGVQLEDCRRSRELVMYTKTHQVPEGDRDGLILVDLDLSILATPEAEYRVYAAAIREEYGWVSDDDYRAGRVKFLQSMLERPSIFKTSHFTENDERRARQNMANEIACLGKVATMSSLYEALGGFDRILALTRHWHELCLADPAAAHPFEHELHPQHDERLAAYLAEAFGGPKLYTAGYGDESYVQKLHACNGEHIELDEACLAAFDKALADLGMTGEPGARASAYFRRATEAQRAYGAHGTQVPEGLPFVYAD
jgi:hemoglobin